MNKSESKYFNTAIKMDEAFMELLEEKDFEYISVKEICERAGVNRSTFYLHYETVGDLLEESVSYMNRTFLEYFSQKSEDFIGKIPTADLDELYLVTPDYLKPYLEYIKEHRRVFLTAIKRSTDLRLVDTFDRMFTHVLNPIMDRFSVSEDEKKYMLSFYMNGILAVIRIWISDNCEDDIGFIIKIISERIHAKER
ncbi:MAG: TetR/AcrR family transcriptional regulator [Lachnospiraceae bacterium]